MIDIEKFLVWINDHKEERPEKLRLRFHGKNVPSWIKDAIDHIESYQKSSAKFITPDNKSFIPSILLPSLSVEQSTSASVAELHMNILTSHIGGTQGNVLDMTCGLGMDTRMFAENKFNVTAIEKDKYRYEIAKLNFRDFNNVQLVNEDCRDFIKKNGRYDAVLIDPARRNANGSRVYNLHDCEPDVSQLIYDLRGITDYVMVKLSPMLDLTETLREIPECSVINVVGNRNECVELLLEIDFTSTKNSMSDKKIKIYQSPRDAEPFTFFLKESLNAKPTDYKDIEENSYVYVPSSATMKAGCFNLISERFRINQISANTHIFSKNHPIDFPLGKSYRVLKSYPFSSSVIKRFRSEFPHGDVFVRNFGLSANELKTRLKLKSSDEIRVMGYQDKNGKKRLAVLARC